MIAIARNDFIFTLASGPFSLSLNRLTHDHDFIYFMIRKTGHSSANISKFWESIPAQIDRGFDETSVKNPVLQIAFPIHDRC